MSASSSFAFPPGDVIGVRRDATGGAPWMTVAFMSLGGGLGPMPEPLADLVMRSAVVRDFAPADFLDIFHHRLLSLRYRVRKQHRVALGAASPEQSRTSDHLFALMGLFRGDLNPHNRHRSLAPQASASAYSATRTGAPINSAAIG